MATTSIGISNEAEPSAEVNTITSGGISEGEHFIVIRLGEEVTVIAPGFGCAVAKYARTLGESLLAAAVDIEQRTQEPQPVRVEA